jgi:hypothetical protein
MTKKTSFVRFKPEVEEIASRDKDAESESKTSLGEFWAINAKTKIKIKLNPEEDSHSKCPFHTRLEDALFAPP